MRPMALRGNYPIALDAGSCELCAWESTPYQKLSIRDHERPCSIGHALACTATTHHMVMRLDRVRGFQSVPEGVLLEIGLPT